MADVQWPPQVPRGFPLTVTARGYVKRIGGKLRWVCGKRSPADALAVYHRKAASLAGGTAPMPEPERVEGIVTMHYILARWLKDRRGDAEAGKLKPATWMQYKLSGKRIDAEVGHIPVEQFSPDHVKALHAGLAKAHGADFARRAIGHLRDCCAHAFDAGWCPAVRLGRKVVAGLVRRPHRGVKWKLLTTDQIRVVLAAIDVKLDSPWARSRRSWQQMKAMILLALNGGYGAMELSQLPREVIDLAGARIDYSRGKTGAQHIVPLWPETVDALRPVMTEREGDVLVFRTRHGNPWCRVEPVKVDGKLVKITGSDHVNERFSELLRELGFKTPGEGFYKLRHVFASAADEFGDTHAASIMQGHSLPGAKRYYVRVSEERLRKLSEFLRHRLLVTTS